MTTHKRYLDLVKWLKRECGGTVTGKCRVRVMTGQGPVFVASTAKDVRTHKNVVALLKRKGIEVPKNLN